MRSRPVLEVRGIGKRYPKDARPLAHLREVLRPSKNAEDGWVLRDLSFSVRAGETVGIIGPNGAGKSTLLQILAGTKRASAGEYQVDGRVAAVLELGTGMEPELTGRENVGLLGSLHGLSEAVIQAETAATLEFAGLTEVADQALRTYSSGMRARLAFAALTGFRPDLLILDEALATGDFAFRNRCARRLRELKEQGVATVVVSHDLNSLQLTCDRILWLEEGSVRAEGPPVEILQDYQVAQSGEGAVGVVPQEQTGAAKILSLAQERPNSRYTLGEDVRIDFSMQAIEALEDVIFTLSVYGAEGDWVIGQTSREAQVALPKLSPGQVCRGSVTILGNLLAPGDYRVVLGAYSRDHTVCHALSSLVAPFSVRADFPVWGRIHHPMAFEVQEEA